MLQGENIYAGVFFPCWYQLLYTSFMLQCLVVDIIYTPSLLQYIPLFIPKKMVHLAFLGRLGGALLRRLLAGFQDSAPISIKFNRFLKLIFTETSHF